MRFHRYNSKTLLSLKMTIMVINLKTITTTFKTFDGLTITTTAYPSTIESSFTIDVNFNADHVDESIVNNAENSESSSDAAMVSNPEAAKALAKTLQPKLCRLGLCVSNHYTKCIDEEIRRFLY